MKLEEAASILGVSVDTSVENLKQTYRKLALHWHPDKCNKPNAKEKFQQLSVAYTKLVSAHTGGNSHKRKDVVFESIGKNAGEDSNEMATFMRMFMDLVGVFNDDKDTTVTIDSKLPYNKGIIRSY